MLHFILDWIFPPRCIICDNIIPLNKPRHFCESCLEVITPLPRPVCEKCGIPVSSGHICAKCKNKKISFERNFAAYAYDDLFQALIHRFKYRSRPEYGAGLGLLTAQAISRDELPEIDCIIPIPIHKKRLRERGFNQSELLARALSKVWSIPVDLSLLIRVKNTKPQSSLGIEARKNNIQGAFAINMLKRKTTPYKTILLVDDIYTTGSTMESASGALKEYGIEKIFCCTLVIASKEHEKNNRRF